MKFVKVYLIRCRQRNGRTPMVDFITVFAQGKNIQKQGQKYLNASSQILEKAQKIQEKSKKEYDEISSAFKYAK